jgi:hypothetical protein
VYRVHHCHDADGPMMAPDFIGGEDKRTVPSDYRAAAYQQLLLYANSAKKDGRHYVDGCWHYELPESCWIINPMETHFVDVIMDIDMGDVVGGTRNRESVVMIRNVTKVDAHDDHLKLLEQVTLGCAQLRVSEAKGTARAKSADVGTMFAIGTRIPYEKKDPEMKVPSTAPYASNGCVSEGILRKLVADLATIGCCCFPQVYSVIRDTEGNTGLLPVPPMDGEALPTPTPKGQTADLSCELEGILCDDGATNDVGEESELVRGERRRRVGYTIDMSVNLGNASHFDVHDASQGFAVWTEDVPGHGENWFFVLPNVHGLKPDGVTKFRGMAVKLGHGVAISWDGRVVRHCTSVSHPDGMEYGRVGEVRDSFFRNHLYGTFTAAKERIVRAGRAFSAASGWTKSDAIPRPVEKRARKRPRKRRGRSQKKEGQVDDKQIVVVPGAGTVVVFPACDRRGFESSERTARGELSCHVEKQRQFDGDSISHTDECKQALEGARGLPTPTGDEVAAVGDCRLVKGDLDVGGTYRIPRKRKQDTEGNGRSLLTFNV